MYTRSSPSERVMFTPRLLFGFFCQNAHSHPWYCQCNSCRLDGRSRWMRESSLVRTVSVNGLDCCLTGIFLPRGAVLNAACRPAARLRPKFRPGVAADWLGGVRLAEAGGGQRGVTMMMEERRGQSNASFDRCLSSLQHCEVFNAHRLATCVLLLHQPPT